MRIGTLVFLLILLLITLGFVSSDDMHTRQRLQEVYEQIGSLQAQADGLRNDLTVCTGQVDGAQAKILEGEQTIAAKDAQIRALEGRIHEMQVQAALLQARKLTADVLGSNPVMLAGLLVYSVVATVLRRRQGAGLAMPFFPAPGKDRLVRLSERELAAVIRGRRARGS